METKYVVFIGPHYPPAVDISSDVDFCLVAQIDCQMEVLATRTVPLQYQGGWRTHMRNKFKLELEVLAKELNDRMDKVACAALLFDLRGKQRRIEEGFNTLSSNKITRRMMGSSSA